MRRASHGFRRPGVLWQAISRQIRHIACHKILLLRARRTAVWKGPAYFYPETPHPYTVVYRLLHRLGIPLRRGLPPAGERALAFAWEDSTFLQTGVASLVGSFINGRCLDISKARVGALHREVFGYSLEVDPTAHRGLMVEKSDENGAHDGRVLEGPLPQGKPGSVYQTVVDNKDDSGAETVCDLRVTIFDGRPTFLYRKHRPLQTRFSNRNDHVTIAALPEEFSPEETAHIAQFCLRIGCDYGEVDCVRDRGTKRIYLLDVNKTPLGPPNGLQPGDFDRALDLYRAAFIQWFQKIGERPGDSHQPSAPSG